MISMKKELNISEILKGKPKGVRLYSPIFSDCTFSFIQGVTDAICVIANNNREFFDYKGLYSPTGERLLFPSKKMRDWRKFDWKKGDVLVNSSGFKLFFDRWANDDYTRFFGKVNLLEDSFSYETEKYTLASKEETLDTLEIEKPEFKDGDIVMSDSGTIVLVRGISLTRKIYYHAYMRNEYIYINQVKGEFFSRISRIKRFATDSEKQQLFDALAKEGKRWDSEKKQIVDLKPKCEFKPMDLCLMKYIGQYNNRGWELCQYAYTEHRVSSSGEHRDFYHAVGGEIYAECIPYNEDTKHLLGTKDKWKGGEG